MVLFAEELEESEKKMRDLAHMSVKGRLAQSLLTIRQQFGTDKEGFIGLEVSRHDLAAFSASTYETVFRTLNDLLKDNLIGVSGKKIKIIEPEKLFKLTENNL